MKSVIIYVYHKSDVSNYNLRFFVKTELTYKENIDYIIVINGFDYDNTIQFPEIDNLKIIKRENIGFDFGGYNAALEYIDENENNKYGYFFFINSSVIGPILPHYFTQIHWSEIFIHKINNKVKLVGTTIVCLPSYDAGGYGPKVEGFFFMVDHLGLSLLRQQKTIFMNHNDKHSAIVNGEYGLSKCILDNGYTIDCMIRKYQGINWRNKNNYDLNEHLHPSRKNSFYGNSLNPYELIFYKWFWHNKPTVNFEIIEQYVNNNT
jgi:hypothetical protein